MRGRVSDPFQPLRAAHIPNAPGSAGGWLPSSSRLSVKLRRYLKADQSFALLMLGQSRMLVHDSGVPIEEWVHKQRVGRDTHLVRSNDIHDGRW